MTPTVEGGKRQRSAALPDFLIVCLPCRPLRCWHRLNSSSPPPFGCLPTSSPPPLSASPACLVAPSLGRLPSLSPPPVSASPDGLVTYSFRSPVYLVTPSAVGTNRGPLLPRHPLLLFSCLTRRPLRCWRHPWPSAALSPPPFGRLCRSYSGVHRRASLWRRWPFR